MVVFEINGVQYTQSLISRTRDPAYLSLRERPQLEIDPSISFEERNRLLEEYTAQFDNANNMFLDTPVGEFDTISISVDFPQEQVDNALRLLGFIRDRSSNRINPVGVGAPFVAILEQLINFVEVAFGIKYMPMKTQHRVMYMPFKLAGILDSMDPRDILLIVLFSQARDLTWIKKWISQEFMCSDRNVMMIYRYVQYYFDHSYYSHDSMRVKIWAAYPAAAHYQGEQDLLIHYMPKIIDHRPSGIVSTEYALDIINDTPILRTLYGRKLLDNAIVAGGSISAILTRAKLFENSDIDIFVYGSSKERTISLLMRAILEIYTYATIQVAGSLISITQEDMRPIQIVSTSATSRDGVLFNFDFSHISVGLDNTGIVMTPDFIYWTTKNENADIRKGGQLTVPIRYIIREFRLRKVKTRDYTVVHMDRSFIKPSSNEPPTHKFETTATIEGAISLLEKEGKFRNDLESIYHSAIHARDLGTMDVIAVDHGDSLGSLTYRDQNGNIRILTNRLAQDGGDYSGATWGVHTQHIGVPGFAVVLDGDLLLSERKPQVGEKYDMIMTPSYLILVKKRCREQLSSLTPLLANTLPVQLLLSNENGENTQE